MVVRDLVLFGVAGTVFEIMGWEIPTFTIRDLFNPLYEKVMVKNVINYRVIGDVVIIIVEGQHD